MCGIFGCLSQQPQNLIKKTIDGLKVLEYRGYDSAGIAYTNQDNLQVVKSTGNIDQLIQNISAYPNTTVCIGHTRWATNGAATLENSHPHLSQDKSIAVVHNGIIENYSECYDYLTKHNIKLKTTVDTEVIPNILYLLQYNIHNIHTFLKGQYVFCAAKRDEDRLFLAKRGSLPLYIGKDDQKTYYVTSDTLALPSSVTQITQLEDLDTCEIINTEIFFYNNNHSIQKIWQPFHQSYIASNKNNFSTYMEKEIHEIPTIIQRITQSYQENKELILQQQKFRKRLKTSKCVHVCGCGTSYHTALILAYIIERDLNIRAIAHISSELTPNTILNEPSLAIVISQSGETADTLACMDILQKHKIPIVALCNVSTSTIAKRSTIYFPLLCGPEIAVASTKAFYASVLVGCLLINPQNTIYCDNLIKTTTNILQNKQNQIPIPSSFPKEIFIIGKGINYFLALEAALKIKEVSYLHCEGYPANELKHGPLSLVNNQTLALVYGTDTTNAITEITARGGKIITIPSPDNDDPLAFISQIIPAQIFALNLAQIQGHNPDRPRNLAKSVTVL